MQLSMLPRPRPQTNANCRARPARVKGQGPKAASRMLCEECGDGELAADATSPVVHQACTAMSRERPEAALRSYGHCSRRRTNDQHAHATFSNHNPTVAGPLLSSKRTWCDFCKTSQLGFRGLARVPPAGSHKFLSPLLLNVSQIKFNTNWTTIQAGQPCKHLLSRTLLYPPGGAPYLLGRVSIMGPQHADPANATTCGEPCLP